MPHAGSLPALHRAYCAAGGWEQIGSKMESLKSLEERLKEISAYLECVCDGRLPLNHDITSNLQDIFNLLPNLNVAELVTAFSVKSNDMMARIAHAPQSRLASAGVSPQQANHCVEYVPHLGSATSA